MIKIRKQRLGIQTLFFFVYTCKKMENQIEKSVKERRAEVIMDDQLRIISEKNEQKIGKTLTVLVEGYENS